MKKRKALFLLPVAALILSGCTFQEGWETVAGFFTNSVYEPVKGWVENLLGIKHEDKKEEQQGGGQQGGGEQQGGEEQKEVSKYGDADHPLSVSAANALIAEANPTEEEVYVVGEVLTNEVWNSEYGQTTITLTDGEQNIKVFRVAEFPEGFDKEGIKANSMKGQTVVAKGIGEIYNNTYELTSPAVLSVTGEGPEHHDVDNYGTEQNPLTVSQAIEVIKLQDPTDENVCVTGKVKSHGNWSSSYNNVDLVITDGTNDLTLFRCGTFPQGIDPTSVKDGAYKDYIVVAKGQGMYYVDGKKYELAQGCEVLSLEKEVIPVTGVEISAQALALEVGEQAALTASVKPDNADQELTWTVESDPATVEVAKYENGKVTALAAGTALVVAKSVADPTFGASCTVTVTEATKTLESIAITGEATKTVYDEEEAYSAEGLKVMAHYDKGEDVDVTSAAEITCSPAVATLGDTKFTVTATYSTAQPATKDVAVTVNAVNKLQKAYEAGMALENDGVTDKAYTFSGVCTAITGNSFFIQNDGYGMYVYNKATANLEIGKVVTVTATLTKYKGLVETKTVSSSEVTGDGLVPTALEVTKYDDLGNANLLANAANAVFKGRDYEWASNKASIVTFTIGGTDVKVKFDKYGFDNAKAQLVNDATAGDVMNLTGVVTSVVDGVNQLLFCGTSTVTNANKEIVSASVTKSPTEVGVNGSITAADVEVSVTFKDTTNGKGRILDITVDTSSAGTATADVTIAGYSNTLHFDVTVKTDVVVQTYSQYFGSNNNDGYMNSSNTGYANVYDVTLGGINWKIPGNQNLNYGLKIGGKLSSETTRSLITQSTFGAPITSVVVTTGTKDSAITVTKCAMKVYSSAANAAADSNMVEEVTATYVDAGTITFAIPANSNWSGIYFALAFSMTSSAASQNKGMVITNITVNF